MLMVALPHAGGRASVGGEESACKLIAAASADKGRRSLSAARLAPSRSAAAGEQIGPPVYHPLPAAHTTGRHDVRGLHQ